MVSNDDSNDPAFAILGDHGVLGQLLPGILPITVVVNLTQIETIEVRRERRPYSYAGQNDQCAEAA